MPTVSDKQRKLMHGVASGSIPATKGKPSKKVAKEFASADHKRGAKKLPTNVGAAINSGKSVKDIY